MEINCRGILCCPVIDGSISQTGRQFQEMVKVNTAFFINRIGKKDAIKEMSIFLQRLPFVRLLLLRIFLLFFYQLNPSAEQINISC